MTLNQALLLILRHLGSGGLSDRYIANSESGDMEIQDQEIKLSSGYFAGQWVAVTGSFLNDGVYKIASVRPDVDCPDAFWYQLQNGTNSDDAVTNEEFFGMIYKLRLTAGFMELAQDFIKYHNDPANAATTAIHESESVAGSDNWSVTRATGKDGKPLTWFDVNIGRLPPKQPYNVVIL